VQEGVKQAQSGAHILDVNVGLPDLDEPSVLEKCVQELQRVCSLPLQLDTSNPLAMERAMRVYNGKPMINSVSGDPRSMDAVFPLIRKYGGLAVCLTLDEKGIPGTARGRLKIAEKILRRAEEFGISPCDLIFDPLALTLSSDRNSAVIALETIALIHKRLKALCCLGVSNISFGLPDREQLNADFLLMALARGLDAAIVNPTSPEIQKAYASYKALSGADENCREYIREAKNRLSLLDKQSKESFSGEPADPGELRTAILDGLSSKAASLAVRALEKCEPFTLIDQQIIPALDAVGRTFESGETFLPQLLLSADAAKAALMEIKKSIPASKEAGPAVILATVKGDIHDIGKNIAKAMLENYGYQIIDLGRDVPPLDIADEAVRRNVGLVGLSALMTTTAPAMAQTIQLLREKKPDCRIVVAGAVITQDYADQIGADHYAQNAMETVRYAAQVFKDAKGKA
jgi:5-methyltetrahydrofolate--homocysteine methyltransferase